MVLTQSQKEIQRKRKIAEAEAKKMADIGTQKRKQIDAEDRARIAGAPEEVVQRDIRAPESVEEQAIIKAIKAQPAEKARQERIEETEIPGVRKLEETGVGAFKDLKITKERGNLQIITETPTGQGWVGDINLKYLKENPERANDILMMTNHMLDNGLTPQQMSVDPITRMILSLELNERDIEMIKSGKSDVNALEITLEGLLGKYVGKVGLVIGATIPKDKINDLEGNIEQIGNSIRDWRMAAARSPQKAEEYLALIEDADEKIRNSESRIKLLIIQSPSMQNSPEEIEKLQSKINRSLNRIGDARNAILGGETLADFQTLQQGEMQ